MLSIANQDSCAGYCLILRCQITAVGAAPSETALAKPCVPSSSERLCPTRATPSCGQLLTLTVLEDTLDLQGFNKKYTLTHLLLKCNNYFNAPKWK